MKSSKLAATLSLIGSIVGILWAPNWFLVFMFCLLGAASLGYLMESDYEL